MYHLPGCFLKWAEYQPWDTVIASAIVVGTWGVGRVTNSGTTRDREHINTSAIIIAELLTLWNFDSYSLAPEQFAFYTRFIDHTIKSIWPERPRLNMFNFSCTFLLTPPWASFKMQPSNKFCNCVAAFISICCLAANLQFAFYCSNLLCF